MFTRMSQIAAIGYLGLVAGGTFCLAQTVPANPTKIEVEVTAEHMDVFDRPDDHGYITGRARRGDHLRIRLDQTAGTGWLAITPLATSILWIEQSDLDLQDDRSGQAAKESVGSAISDRGRIDRAWIHQDQAVIRSGNALARLPGPRKGTLPGGTLVQLVDRPALELNLGTQKVRLLAIVPPSDQAFFIHADGIRWPKPTSLVPAVAEVRASYEEPAAVQRPAGPAGKNLPGASTTWPAEVSAELDRTDGIFRLIVTSQTIAQWRLETVRAGYQNLLQRTGGRQDLEDALRTRLARVTQHERAARAARTIESILARSHRRDLEVAAANRELTQLERAHDREFDAVGFIQPSARMVDGHKVFALIGSEGKTDAYLDIPPGLNPQPFLASRVGVRGEAHFREDLGTRLITVRDMESTEQKR